MEVYERVIKVVKPKRAKLKEAEDELAEQMGKLRQKQENGHIFWYEGC